MQYSRSPIKLTKLLKLKNIFHTLRIKLTKEHFNLPKIIFGRTFFIKILEMVPVRSNTTPTPSNNWNVTIALSLSIWHLKFSGSILIISAHCKEIILKKLILTHHWLRWFDFLVEQLNKVFSMAHHNFEVELKSPET